MFKARALAFILLPDTDTQTCKLEAQFPKAQKEIVPVLLRDSFSFISTLFSCKEPQMPILLSLFGVFKKKAFQRLLQENNVLHRDDDENDALLSLISISLHLTSS